MNLYVLLNLAIVVFAIIFAFFGRLIYMRSKRLREKLRMGYVFTNITHELLTPLTVLSASVDKMREEAPQLSHDYDLMQINIQRGSILTNSTKSSIISYPMQPNTAGRTVR